MKLLPNPKTYAEVKKRHKQLWLWCAKNPEKPKYTHPSWDTRWKAIRNHCWLCYWFVEKYNCDKCPLRKVNECGINGWYGRWSNAKSKKLRAQLALKIAHVVDKEKS